MADDRLLRRAAGRASASRFYLASSLLAYARAERLDDVALAARLGCAPASLPSLLLCRRPAGEGSMFRADVEAIAERFGLEAARLARLIRSGDVLVTLGEAGHDRGGQLAAARDRQPAGAPDPGPAGGGTAEPAPAPAAEEDAR